MDIKFSKVENTYPAGKSTVYTPVAGRTNYRSISIATPSMIGEDGKATGEDNIAEKFFFYEFFDGQKVSQLVDILHQDKKHAPGQKAYPVQKVVETMNYLGEPVKNPEAVVRMEAWLDQNSI